MQYLKNIQAMTGKSYNDILCDAIILYMTKLSGGQDLDAMAYTGIVNSCARDIAVSTRNMLADLLDTYLAGYFKSASVNPTSNRNTQTNSEIPDSEHAEHDSANADSDDKGFIINEDDIDWEFLGVKR